MAAMSSTNAGLSCRYNALISYLRIAGQMLYLLPVDQQHAGGQHRGRA
ncbi:hypothetical protein BN439_2581 [Erwinia amylovora Ea644]|nr:hypothetical protein BN439_2581 [Erwinia amylovora Ea644]CCP07667.1 hypothetical protein BN440_2653 [Erwinia amylovora MR1]